MPSVSFAFVLIIVLNLVIWIGIGIAVVVVARHLLGPRVDESEKILRERLARGEISQADFENVQQILRRCGVNGDLGLGHGLAGQQGAQAQGQCGNQRAGGCHLKSPTG